MYRRQIATSVGEQANPVVVGGVNSLSDCQHDMTVHTSPKCMFVLS